MSWKVYVIHFCKPYKHAQHYTGIAKCPESRFEEHQNGTGARLTQVASELDIPMVLHILSEFDDYSMAHQEERRRKKMKKASLYCPSCREFKD